MIQGNDYKEILALAIGPAVIGIAATFIRHIRKGSCKGMAAGAVTSIFVAITTGFLLDIYDLPPTVVSGIIGLASYSGGTLLDALLWRLEKEIKTAKIRGLHNGDEG